jgi:predicted DNA-binding transcriptional regulator AlpA
MRFPAAATSPYPIGGSLLNEHRAAEFLGLKVSTLRRWRWAGRGPPFIKLGSAVRYDPRELDEFVDAGRRRSTSDTGDGR